jgi:formamidopyrimidine-DNA glycosylase
MPELPEVETVVRDLRPLLVGRTVTGVRQSKRKLRRPWRAEWAAEVAGARIEGLRRRGKWILVDLTGEPGASATGWTLHPVADAPGSPEPCLRIHLGMSGQFTVASATEPEPDHLHVVFALDNATELRLRDPRRFGSAEYFPSRGVLEEEMNAELGPEPFGLDADYFRDAVRGTSRNLKAILLDQKTVAGVGNIYADEACFRAKLHPGRTGKSLSPEECDRLREAVEMTLTRAIESRGSTIRDYVGGSGLRGGFQDEFAVYGRTDEPCPACGAAIKCARYAGRASHYCPVCQKKSSPQRHKVHTKTHKGKPSRVTPRRSSTRKAAG